MAKKTLRRVRREHRKVARAKSSTTKDYLVIVRGWMFVVAFALMLGVGAITGNYLAQLIDVNMPAVAGVQTEAR